MSKMSKNRWCRATLAVAAATAAAMNVAMAQDLPAPSGQRSLAATLGIYAFPTGGQSAQQQSEDQGACYSWAVQDTGVDPFDSAKQLQQSKAQAYQNVLSTGAATQGAGAGGAFRGAAGGAAIGAMAGNAGEGAAIGAGAGLLFGRMMRRREEEAAELQAEQQVQQAQQVAQQQTGKFKKAFSVCLKAKKYLVED